MALQLCPSCARHVRDSESRCPFCDGVLPLPRATAVAIPRLSRAAQVAFVATLAIGCHEEAKPPNDPTTTPPPIATIEPPANTATATTAAPAPTDAGPPDYIPPPNLKKPYGAPPADGLFT